jgi:hypothetical protein
MNLIEKTERLMEECEASKTRFFQMRELDAAPHFFDEVKPHADYIHQLLDEWKAEVIQWIFEHKPKYLHRMQIEHAVDAMNQFVVQSFYKETSKKRFLQSVHSVHYTLSTLLRFLRGEMADEE